MAGNRRLFSLPRTSSHLKVDDEDDTDDDNDNGILASNRNGIRTGLSNYPHNSILHHQSQAEPSQRLVTNSGAHLLPYSTTATDRKSHPAHKQNQNQNPSFHCCSEEDKEESHGDLEQNEGDPPDPNTGATSFLSSDPNGFLYTCFKCNQRLGQGRDIYIYRFEEEIQGRSAACMRGSHWLQMGYMLESLF